MTAVEAAVCEVELLVAGPLSPQDLLEVLPPPDIPVLAEFPAAAISFCSFPNTSWYASNWFMSSTLTLYIFWTISTPRVLLNSWSVLTGALILTMLPSGVLMSIM